MNKKAIIWIIIILFIILSFAAGIILLIRQNKQQENAEPEVRQPELRVLVDEAVISPITSSDGLNIWFFNDRGKLFQVSSDGAGLTEVQLPILPDAAKLIEAKWPGKGNDFIAMATNSLGSAKYYYDSQQKKYVALPENVQSLDWLPDNRRILYIWKSGDKLTQQLVLANPDTSGFRILKEVFWPDLVVAASPVGNEALLYRSRIEEGVNKIYLADLLTGEFEIVIGDGKNTGAMWLPEGRGFLFNQISASGIVKLMHYSFATRLQTDLNLNMPVSKVGIGSDGKYIFAAMPQSEGMGEKVVKLDLAGFQQETYFELPENFRARSLMVVGNRLYLINSLDQKLYLIQ